MSCFPSTLHRPVLASLVALALTGAMALAPAVADEDVAPSGYPSWQDVQKAQQDEAGTASEIQNINGLLDSLETQAQSLGDAAVASAASYAEAEAVLRDASTRLDVLTAQSARAAEELSESKKELGALAARAYRTGGTNKSFFVALDALQKNNIQGLNIVELVGGKTASLVSRSAVAEKTASALAGQEALAKAEREALTLAARTHLETAETAQSAVASQVQEQQSHGDELIAQLATLKGTTAAVEEEFRQGQAAQAAYDSAQAAKRAAAEEAAAEEQARQAAAAQQARFAADSAARESAAQAAQQAAAAAAQAAAQAANKPPAAQQPAPQQPARPPANQPAPVPAPAPVAPAPPPAVVPAVPGGAVNDPRGAQAYASGQLSSHGWGQDQMSCLVNLWSKESGWRTNATNPSSGAYGIAQSLPASKYGSAGSDWLTNYRTQVNWGLGYIADRYGSPCGAWAHSMAVNWY
ncbi:lytic transglycosylase domain-containing protein [Pseudarthrobacter sp. PS3-L1]|uniref:aggregation-promoting factor C-terminal-like domain-containing protein n=1 Tax=Pseudarthrobacter sp. PS3-L1 TaxID=3046207 RepID=UPI0024B963D9|nr:lytic transglycosylase domain-containing protein [Pseudarthrobacter sp. PS3-L1]MDJ0320002.1 lytic transglycosylase domain-containing protein [Pseudarthrobacter sp. PS3-L1]